MSQGVRRDEGPQKLSSRVIDAVWSAGVGQSLNHLMTVAVIDDGDAGIGAAFVRRERVASVW